jgi:hypothetical protein
MIAKRCWVILKAKQVKLTLKVVCSRDIKLFNLVGHITNLGDFYGPHYTLHTWFSGNEGMQYLIICRDKSFQIARFFRDLRNYFVPSASSSDCT